MSNVDTPQAQVDRAQYCDEQAAKLEAHGQFQAAEVYRQRAADHRARARELEKGAST